MSEINSMAAGEYVLGTLAPSERREFERRLASDPLLRAQVAEWERELAPLLDPVEPMQPSPATWERIASSVSQMEGGDNVVPIRRSATRRFVPAALVGAIAASIAGFVVVRSFPGQLPAQPSAQTTAPAVPSQVGAEPATGTRIATPCPSDSGKSVQTADGAREPSIQREPSSGSVSVAGAVRDQGGVAVGGHPQRSNPEGSNNVSIASATRPEGSGAVTAASGAAPDRSNSVSMAAATRPEGSGNVSLGSASKPEPRFELKTGAKPETKPETKPASANGATPAPASAPQGNGNVVIASTNSDCK